MQQFTIQTNGYLSQNILAFYHSDYQGGGGQWQIAGTIENIICTLKNDITPYSQSVLQNASNQLSVILREDLPQILRFTGKTNFLVCVIPRAKVNYQLDQLYFRTTIRNVVNGLNGFINSVDYIIRHTDTQTTHRAKWGYGGTGSLPYPGITAATCNISAQVIGKDILLIDDLYTKTVNIDEDAIQALLNKGANSVVFYAVGRTVFKNL
jgi:hypothetical protein